jgi:hypothetical protein
MTGMDPCGIPHKQAASLTDDAAPNKSNRSSSFHLICQYFLLPYRDEEKIVKIVQLHTVMAGFAKNPAFSRWWTRPFAKLLLLLLQCLLK